jgi:hypothetical protein
LQKYRNYTNEDVIKAVQQSHSIASVCRQIGLAPLGGNYRTVKLLIQRLELDASHFFREAANKGVYKNLGELHTNKFIKGLLIREHGHQCFMCKNTVWNGKPIAIELEHIDGDTTNTDKSNLSLLCPNCHAQTPTYRRKKSSL